MNVDVMVIGAGPAGLSASIKAYDEGAKVLVVEREKKTGGILKQCIHDGFGLIRFKEKLSGPEYAERFINETIQKSIDIMTSTYVDNIEKTDDIFKVRLINSKEGVFEVSTKSIVIATGCRERTPKQVFIHGNRPAGVYTAGTAQHFVNILGYLPCKRCVILGSGDIGLIMARRLTLEGAEVVGVYEAKPTPSGLSRNIAQCLEDFDIPLHLSTTVTRIIGSDRVMGVEVSKVDGKMQPIKGTEELIECDGLILSVGLIPENEIAESLGIDIEEATKGPYFDQSMQTMTEGVFSCGNALHVNDLVDYVSESGEIAGAAAAKYAKGKSERKLVKIEYDSKDFLYVVPQYIDMNSSDKVIVYFRSRNDRKKTKLNVIADEDINILHKTYMNLKPPEMQRIEIEVPIFTQKVKLILQEG